MSQPENNSRKRTTIMMILLAVITVAALCVTMWALFLREPDGMLTPDYAPREEESHAQPIPDDSGEKMEAAEGGGTVSLTYATDVTIRLSTEQATLMFANPGKSTQDMVVQVVIQDTVLVQSGRLTPGKQVTTLDLLDGAAEKLAVGGYEGKFVVLYYDTETGEKAIVNTEIPVTVSVVK